MKLYKNNLKNAGSVDALTLTALRMDPMTNFLVLGSLLASPFCVCPFCSWASSVVSKGLLSVSISPSSRAIFSPLKLGFSYKTHLSEREQQKQPTSYLAISLFC